MEVRVEVTGPTLFASDFFFRYPLEIYLKLEIKSPILERTSFTLRILSSSGEWGVILQLDIYLHLVPSSEALENASLSLSRDKSALSVKPVR